MNIITLNEELLLEGVWDTMKEKFGNDKVAKFRQLKDGNQLPSGGDFEQKKNPQYWNNKTVEEFNEYLNNVIEGNLYNDRQKEELTSKLRTKLARTINVSAANELARAFWEHRNEIQDQEQRNIKYWIQNQNVGYSDLAAVLQPIQARKSNSAGRYDKVYESDFMIIYKVYDWIAARNLSKGTSWCITGRYSSENGDGSGFFTRYLPRNGKEEGSQYHYYYIVHDLTHPITYRGNLIRSHTDNTPQQYCMVINGRGKIKEVWEPGDTEIGKIPWIPVEHQVQPIPGVKIPYGDVDDWPEPERVDLAGHADNVASQFVIEDGELVRCNIQSGTVYIPDSVTKIGNDAFANSAITQVIIPNSVTEIGNNTFWKCIYLKSVTLPNSLAKIGSNAFRQCIRLESITIPDSVTEIPSSAFQNCTSLKSVTIPNSVTKIDYGAFSGCTSLKSIAIPNSITEIAKHTFYDCYSLESITIPSSVTEIGENAFYTCTSLESITIPNNVTKIGDHAFHDCTSLKSVVISESVTEIGTYAFYNCWALQNITIPSGITEIKDYAFADCTSLKSVVISDSVTRIGTKAFESCDSLKNIEIPNSVIEIGYKAFYMCRSLKSITIQGSANIALYMNIFDACHTDLVVNTDNRIVINYCVRNNINYQRITPQQGEESQQVDDITSQFTIENGTLVSCDINSGTVHIPNTVTKIGSAAFRNKDITKVIIPNGVTEIGRDAFYNCTSLESITIPEGVTEIGENAFSYCTSLQSVTIPDSVIELGIDVFKNCISLQSVKLSANITEIPVNAFIGCSSLESIIIPNGVIEISINAFKFCYALQNVVIPNSVEQIGYGAFANCTSLKSITIPNSVTDIGITAFEHCHEDLVINTDNEVIINYCEQTGTNYRRITPQRINEPQHVNENDFRAAFNMAMRNRVGGH